MNYHITGAYFSPTGGTRRAIEMLCSSWEGEHDLVDLGDPKRPELHLGEKDLLVLALPVYAGTIPEVKGLLDNLHGNHTPCVVAATYGNCKYDHALAQMKKYLGQRGFCCVAGITIITPHVFAPTLGTDRPDEKDKEDLLAFASKVETKLSEENWQEAEVPGNPDAPLRTVKPLEKMRDWDICVGCGFCAYSCPTGAMDAATLMWDNTKCISCMTCVAKCPNGALGFNSSAIASKLTAAFTARQSIETFL